MKTVRMTSVGASSQNASVPSRSSARLIAPRLTNCRWAGFAASKTLLGAAIDLAHFARGPLHSFLRRHALHALRVHVGDDVLRQHLGGLAVRRPGVARREAEA